MRVYTERQEFKVSKTQKESLRILKSYGIDVSDFIREAIKQKIKTDWKDIKELNLTKLCPF